MYECTCRICHGEKPGGLICPCACDDALKYVHRACLDDVRANSPWPHAFTRCETCKAEYNIVPVEASMTQQKLVVIWLRVAGLVVVDVGLTAMAINLLQMIIYSMALISTRMGEWQAYKWAWVIVFALYALGCVATAIYLVVRRLKNSKSLPSAHDASYRVLNTASPEFDDELDCGKVLAIIGATLVLCTLITMFVHAVYYHASREWRRHAVDAWMVVSRDTV